MGAAEIIKDIESYIARIGGNEFSWYIGIASNVGQALFTQHSVNRVNGAWTYREINDGESFKGFIESLRAAGYDVAPGINEQPGNFVYVFLKTEDTTPSAEPRREK